MLATKANTSFPMPEPQQDGGVLYTGLFFYKLGTQEYCCKIQLLGMSTMSVEAMQDDLVNAVNEKLCKDHPWDELQQLDVIEPRASQYEKGLAAGINDAIKSLSHSGEAVPVETKRMQWPDVVRGFREIFAAPVSPTIMEEILRFFYPIIVKFSELNYKEGFDDGIKGGREGFVQEVERRLKESTAMDTYPVASGRTQELQSLLEWLKK